MGSSRRHKLTFPMVVAVLVCMALNSGESTQPEKGTTVIDLEETVQRLRSHLTALTVTIGERSIHTPENLTRTQEYIETVYGEMGQDVTTEPYHFRGLRVANVIAQIDFSERPSRRYLLGAHYDCVAGTVGADDNASAVAVQLETARNLRALVGLGKLDLSVKFVSFALEENPAFATPYMGSRVHARKAKERNEKIDGMICLEMVGYTCREPGCQGYPFPLMYMNYPKEGNFIGIVGNTKSRNFTHSLLRAFRRNTNLPAIPLTVPFNGWLIPSVRLSDHSAFWDAGFKAVMITDSAFFRNPHYHQASDAMDTLDYPFMAQLVESLVTFFRHQ